jgi:hypothetical protein
MPSNRTNHQGLMALSLCAFIVILASSYQWLLSPG